VSPATDTFPPVFSARRRATNFMPSMPDRALVRPVSSSPARPSATVSKLVNRSSVAVNDTLPGWSAVNRNTIT
jgi:hypothetical protein